jgi:hypothetical protein
MASDRGMRFPELTGSSLQHLNLPKDCKGEGEGVEGEGEGGCRMREGAVPLPAQEDEGGGGGESNTFMLTERIKGGRVVVP